MMDDTGEAREIPAGRLANFEDDTPLGATAPLLPPRRSTTPAAPTAAPPLPVERPRKPEGAQRPVEPRRQPSAPSKAPRPTQGTEDRVRPSNVHIPVSLLEPLVRKCTSDGLSHGEVIIVAIENAHPRLKDIIHPAATAGGGLFASRRSRASRKADGPLTPLNYRLREGDFATLDELVEEFGASSRGHLITAALNDYFSD